MGDGLHDKSHTPLAVNFFERGLQLTRTCRALKVWVSVHSFGLGSFRSAIAKAFELARYAEECIEASPVLEVISRPSLGILVFGVSPILATADCKDPQTQPLDPNEQISKTAIDDLNMRLLGRLNDSGLAYLSSVTIRGRRGIRMCTVNHKACRDDVRGIIDTLSLYAAESELISTSPASP